MRRRAPLRLLTIEGLEPGLDHPYEVRLDGERVWPEPLMGMPPSSIRLLGARERHDIVFGSCRITLPHEPPYTLRAHEHPDGQGTDALRAYALRAAAGRPLVAVAERRARICC